MSGGQQIDTASGDFATSGKNTLINLKSRKTGTGAATRELVGSSLTPSQGTFLKTRSIAATGSSATISQESIGVVSNPTWIGTPAPSFEEGSTTAYSLSSFISSYNAGTDSFSLGTGSASLPSWLSISGGTLVPDGTQVSTDDFSGLILKVTRVSATLTADSASFSVAVTSSAPGALIVYDASYATPTLTDTWPNPDWSNKRLDYGKHTKIAYCTLTGDLYFCGGDGQGQHWGGSSSGSLDTVGRYNVETHTYTEDFLYRGYVGEVVPRGCDNIGFTWSPNRNEFWLGPGYGWDYTTSTYPWVETSFSFSHFASYDPVTKHFTDRGAKPAAALGLEGFMGAWDTLRDRLVWVDYQTFKSLNPDTNQLPSFFLG